MAGNDNGERIAIIRHSDRAKTLRPSHCARNVAIAASFAIRNCQQGAPACQLEIGSAQVKREAELAPFACEIFFQLLNVRPQCVWRFFDAKRFFGCFGLGLQIARIGANRLLAGKAGIKLKGHQS